MIQIDDLYQYYRQHPQVITDSRRIEAGCLFFALKGPNFNGNAFAEEALTKGAAYAVIDEPDFQVNDRCLLVDDVLTSLQALATHHRRQLEIPLIAITGSNGKTTTKELMSEALGCHYRTHFTRGNLNNHIGVPLTLLAMPMDTEIAVIEMGANHQGEIAALCRIAEPTHGLITNIGKAHLESFGGLEGVKKGKSELYQFLATHRGLAFVNLDEAFLVELSEPIPHRLFY
ncbi:MAG: Mur ligase family protein, partial [Bacteroidota bacterium]